MKTKKTKEMKTNEAFFLSFFFEKNIFGICFRACFFFFIFFASFFVIFDMFLEFGLI